MAHNAYVRGNVGSGLWTSLPVVHGYMEQLDQYVFQSVNGDLGGTWAPATTLIFGGSGVSVTGPFVSSGNAGFTGAVQFLGSATCTTVFSFIAGLLSGDSFCDLNWAGNTAFSGDNTFSAGTTTFAHGFVTSGATIPVFGNGLIVAAGTSIFAGPVEIDVSFRFVSGSTPQLEAPLQIKTGGYVRHKKKTGVDANTTYNIAVDGDRIIWGSLTADRDATIADATDGAEMIVALDVTGTFSGHRVTLKRADTTVIAFLDAPGGGLGTYRAMHLLFDGTAWKHHSESVNPS